MNYIYFLRLPALHLNLSFVFGVICFIASSVTISLLFKFKFCKTYKARLTWANFLSSFRQTARCLFVLLCQS